MSTIHYSDANGVYIGGFGDGAEPPAGAIERPAPDNANMIWANDAWVAPTIDPAVALAAERAAMVCSRLQGRLVLGETVCAKLDAMAEDPATPWAMRETIKGAGNWYRTSQSMDELGYLLQYTPEQMDALFRIAMKIMV